MGSGPKHFFNYLFMSYYVKFSFLFGTETFTYSLLVNVEISPDEVVLNVQRKLE